MATKKKPSKRGGKLSHQYLRRLKARLAGNERARARRHEAEEQAKREQKRLG